MKEKQMSLSDDVKTALEDDDELMAILTGGIHNGVEEISKQNTPSAFDANGEIMPCALIKVPIEIPTGPFARSVRTSFVIYLYQFSGYDAIEPAMGLIFDDLNEQRIGTNVWNIEFNNAVYQQRDQALDCPLGSLRFIAIREL
jgi:hypothetical protein